MAKTPVIGQLYGRLTWDGLPPERGPDRKRYFRMLCTCGKDKFVAISNILSGNSRSCGCLQRELATRRLKTHGMRNSPGYAAWVKMFQRCYNPSNRKYLRYGGRGIQVCGRWKDFAKFLEDMGPRPFIGASLERLDNDGDYCKTNCVWATAKQQARNKSNTLYVDYQGTSQKLADLVKGSGPTYARVYARIYRLGWSVERAIDTP